MKDYQEEYRKNMTDEQKQKYKVSNEQKQKYRKNFTDEQKQNYKDHRKEYRKNMTDEQKKIEIIKKNIKNT